MLGNTGTDYAAALVLMTDWELWVTGQSYVDQFDPNTESTGWNQPLSLQFKDVYKVTRFMTYIPMINPSSIHGTTKITLYGVFMPYSHDITTYYMYLLSNNGVGMDFF